MSTPKTKNETNKDLNIVFMSTIILPLIKLYRFNWRDFSDNIGGD